MKRIVTIVAGLGLSMVVLGSSFGTIGDRVVGSVQLTLQSKTLEFDAGEDFWSVYGAVKLVSADGSYLLGDVYCVDVTGEVATLTGAFRVNPFANDGPALFALRVIENPGGESVAFLERPSISYGGCNSALSTPTHWSDLGKGTASVTEGSGYGYE